ncbi:MAG: cyclic nucleotide-binding domain-containing protein [Chromatiaceae bacterium]|nr:MAG: cyclic nucleotide-binding domain-containing protein [Chromatiaceae bacterium]
MNEIEDLFRRHPFAAGLDDEIIAFIAGCASNAVFPAGSYLFREGAAADRFYLIRHGTVAVETYLPGHGAMTVLTVKDGELLGASWLIPPYRYAFDGRAVELTRVLAFNAKCLREKAEADHHVGYELMKRFIPPLIARLQIARLQALDCDGVAAVTADD